jgi:hypothetical protein
MKQNSSKLSGLAAAALCLALAPASLVALPTFAQTQAAAVPLSEADRQLVAAFEARVKGYSKMREQLEERLPKLPKEATPEQITAHKTTFQEMVRSARSGAKQGDVFTPEAVRFIRATLKDEFKGRERAELRQTVFEAETQGVPLRVNYPYPESKELVEMPPTLLLRLPQLPKQVRYRFVGNNLLLVDRENGLIVDYMTGALP